MRSVQPISGSLSIIHKVPIRNINNQPLTALSDSPSHLPRCAVEFGGGVLLQEEL